MTGADTSLFSVIIATRNRADALKRCLQALDRQEESGKPFEVIVVDDGSTDGTETSAKNNSYKFPLKYIKQEARGPAAARNTGLEKACGDIALFLNDDCLAIPGLLTRHRVTHPGQYECTVLGRIEWAPEYDADPLLKELVDKHYFPYYQIVDREEVSFAYFITGNLSVPLQKVKEAGGFDERFSEAAFEDIELGYRLDKMGLNMKYDPEALAYHLHDLDFNALFDRQQKVAYWLNAFLEKHPEAQKLYPGADSAPGLPVYNRSCLEMILRYASYRGLKSWP